MKTLVIIAVLVFFGMYYIISSIQKKRREEELNTGLSSPITTKVNEEEEEKNENENENSNTGNGGCVVFLLMAFIIGCLGYNFIADNFFFAEEIVSGDSAPRTVMVVKKDRLTYNSNGSVSTEIRKSILDGEGNRSVILVTKYSDGSEKTDTIVGSLAVSTNWESVK